MKKTKKKSEEGGLWIQGAVKHRGAVRKAAVKHGRSVLEEARAEEKSPNKKIAARGRLALRFKGAAKQGNILKKGQAKRSRVK